MKYVKRRQNTEEEEDVFVLETIMMRGGVAPPGGHLSYLWFKNLVSLVRRRKVFRET